MPGTGLEGRTALVTGAAKRLGREAALSLAREGVNVVVHYGRSAAEAGELVADIARLGVGSWSLQADLGDPRACESLPTKAREAAGRLDFLVNNASIYPGGGLDALTIEALMESIGINAWAPFAVGRAFAGLGGPGKIVNLLDARIDSPDLDHAGYYLSKRLLADLTGMMALAWAPQVSVNAVAPGLILPPAGKDDRWLEALAQRVPLRRRGKGSDVAGAILYLLGAEFVTGQVIYVDGGQRLDRREQPGEGTGGGGRRSRPSGGAG